MVKRGTKNKGWKAIQSAFTFRNRAADEIPRRPNKGFSGPIAPLIPAEARRKPKNFEVQEPTSPKISCIGRIKPCKAFDLKPDKSGKAEIKGPNPATIEKKRSRIKMFFPAGRKSDASIDRANPPGRGAAPSLTQMRGFASSRDALAGFDWMAATQVSPADDREYYSGEVIIPFSAPNLGRVGLGSRNLG